MRQPRSVSLSVLELALVAALPATGPTVYGSITGTVKDATGAIVSRAKVWLINLGTCEQLTTQSGADGSYAFVNLAPGTYSISVERPGFHRVVRRVAVEQSTVRIDASLTVGQTADAALGQVRIFGGTALAPAQKFFFGTNDVRPEFRRLAGAIVNISPRPNLPGVVNYYQVTCTRQSVAGDTYSIRPGRVADFHAALRGTYQDSISLAELKKPGGGGSGDERN